MIALPRERLDRCSDGGRPCPSHSRILVAIFSTVFFAEKTPLGLISTATDHRAEATRARRVGGVAPLRNRLQVVERKQWHE